MSDHPQVRIVEASFDEAEERGHDGTLRTETGPLVKVMLEADSQPRMSVDFGDGKFYSEFYAVLVEARINPAQLDEI